MDIVKESIIQNLAQICDKAYKLEEALHPKFAREVWQDQVATAEAVAADDANDYQQGLATIFAEGNPLEAWAAGVLSKNHEFVMARLQLYSVYNQAKGAIESASDEALAPTLLTLEAPAIGAAVAVGSTAMNDKMLTVMVKQWVSESIELIEPTLDVEDEEG